MKLQEEPLPMGTRVTTNIEICGKKINGWISGIADVPAPVVGYRYIVMVDTPIEGYGYTHLAFNEVNLELQS